MPSVAKNEYTRTLDRLYSLQKFGIKLGLSSTRNLLNRLGNPEKEIRTVHLAGTNGKGSVGASLVSILSRAGYKVGFYTSPHLISFRERFVISQKMISRRQIINLYKQVNSVVAQEEPPTFFEFVTAMALCWFNQQKVDLAVMEAGLGGRLDATNIIKPLLGIITNISKDHTEYLGHTLKEIASEKAGIIKPRMPVITGEQRPKLQEIFRDKVRQKRGKLFILGKDFKIKQAGLGRFHYYGLGGVLKNIEPGLIGKYQTYNAALALTAVDLLAKKGFSVTEDHIRQGLKSVYWPGRAEMFYGKPDVMLDGAHNPAAAAALAELLAGLDYKKIHMVLGILKDKDVPAILKKLAPAASRLYLTRPEYFRASEPEDLAVLAGDYKGIKSVHKTVPQAVRAAKKAAGAKDLVLVAGSLFTVGEARGYLTGQTDN